MNPKVIVIGLDGATWDLIRPWADSGELPNLKKMIENGSWGNLESTKPPVTFPAWESLFTGQNPGKLGVFDFMKVDVKSRKIDVNMPENFQGNPVWKILNAYGYKTCMVNIPTSKVEEVNGVMVGGPFCEEGETFPPEFDPVLKKFNYENYPTELTKVFMESTNSIPSIDIIRKTISSRFEMARFLAETENPDFLALVIFVIDNIQHFYWGKDIVLHAWKIIDEEIGKFMNLFRESIFVLVSDHGFAEYKKTFYTSKFLEKEKLIAYRTSPFFRIFGKINQSVLVNIAKKTKLDKVLLKLFSKEKLQYILFSFPSKEGRVEMKGLENMIDWEKSKCIPMSNAIYLNCGESEKKKLKEELKNKLMSTGLVKNVYFKENVYSGKFFNEAPDIILEPMRGVRILESPLVNSVVSGRSGNWRGMHETHGIALFYGPRIKKSRIDAEIYDIAPTILSFFGIEPNGEMDGKVLHVRE